MKKVIIVVLFSISCSVIGAWYTKYYEGNVTNNFDGKRFFDPEQQQPNTNLLSFLKWQFSREKNYWPEEKILVEKYDIPPKRVSGNEIRVTYVGHVTYLIQTQSLNILTDPVWSERASPFSFAGPKRIIDPGIKFEDLPPIDIVLISHNHYDHMDLATIDRLWYTYKPRIITPLGNDVIIKSHNKDVNAEVYDWEDVVKINDNVQISLEPMQHWSARGIFDRNKALWAAFVIQTSGGNIYFVGDSGYGKGRYFKAAKNKYGSFKVAMLPIGAYEPRWFMEYAHMNPDDAVQAYLDLGEPFMIPGHFDVFKLTDEPYGDALIKLTEAMTRHKTGKNIIPLKVGQFFYVP